MDFLANILAEPPTLLGLKLLPFSVGHYAILSNLQNPFITSGQQGLHDCIMLILVCSKDYATAKSWIWNLSQADLAKESRKLAKKYPNANVGDLTAAIQVYLANFAEFPKVWHKEDSEDQTIPEFIRSVLVTLMRKCRMTESEAINCPLSRAVHYCIEANGQTDSLVSEIEQQALANSRGAI